MCQWQIFIFFVIKKKSTEIYFHTFFNLITNKKLSKNVRFHKMFIIFFAIIIVFVYFVFYLMSINFSQIFLFSLCSIFNWFHSKKFFVYNFLIFVSWAISIPCLSLTRINSILVNRFSFFRRSLDVKSCDFSRKKHSRLTTPRKKETRITEKNNFNNSKIILDQYYCCVVEKILCVAITKNRTTNDDVSCFKRFQRLNGQRKIFNRLR